MMFYRQSVNNIKLAILSLDGGLLDLNRLRFNYFKRICKDYNIQITRKEFEQSLGNMNTMYNSFDIVKDINPSDLNNLIEKDLFEYAKYKIDYIKKDGVDELIQFFEKKGIKIAVVSSHRTKNAIHYLQLAKLYDKIDFVIGGDSDNPPLPDGAILKTTLQQMNCKAEEAIVVANCPNLLTASNHCLTNVIYLTDLCPFDESYTPRIFKKAKNNLEIINIFLFDQYDSIEMYSSLLGMSANMSLDTLNRTYNRLLKEYENDQQLIELVKSAYHYYLAVISVDNSSLDIEENQEVKVEKPVITNAKPIVKDDPQEINRLMNLINGLEKKETKEPEKMDIKENDDNVDKGHNHYLENIFFTSVIVTVVSLFLVLLYNILYDFINSPGMIKEAFCRLIAVYVSIIVSIVRFTFNTLNSLVASIPNYNIFMKNDSANILLYIVGIIFNIFIVYAFKLVFKLVTEVEEDDEYYSYD